MAKKRKGLPQGVNYAQVLAEEKRKKDALERYVREKEMQVHAEIQGQRLSWLMVKSISDAYGFGPKRLEPFFEKLKENSDEFLRMTEEVDYDYALEKLRLDVERKVGSKITYLYEDALKGEGKSDEDRTDRSGETGE